MANNRRVRLASPFRTKRELEEYIFFKMTMNLPWKILFTTKTCFYCFEQNVFYRYHMMDSEMKKLDPILIPEAYINYEYMLIKQDSFGVRDMQRIRTNMKQQCIFARHVHYDPHT